MQPVTPLKRLEGNASAIVELESPSLRGASRNRNHIDPPTPGRIGRD